MKTYRAPATDPALRKMIENLEAEFRQVAEEQISRERAALVDYQGIVAREVLLTEQDIERKTGLGVRLDRLRDILRIGEEKPAPRVGLCRFAR